MHRRTLLTITAASPWLAACAKRVGYGGGDMRGVGIVVEESLAPNAAVKEGVEGISDTGRELFGTARLSERNSSTNIYGGAGVPRWVRVTWRKGADTARGLHWTTGRVVGDFTVPVLERIPPEAFALIRGGKKRALVLRFRLRDDGVDFGWMVQVQERGFEVLMKGGDF